MRPARAGASCGIPEASDELCAEPSLSTGIGVLGFMIGIQPALAATASPQLEPTSSCQVGASPAGPEEGPRPGRPGPGAQWPKLPVSRACPSHRASDGAAPASTPGPPRRRQSALPLASTGSDLAGLRPPGPARGARSSPRLGAQGAASVDGQGEQHASIGFLVLRAFKLRLIGQRVLLGQNLRPHVRVTRQLGLPPRFRRV